MRISGWNGGLAYLATPYSRRGNLDEAFDEAAKLTAVLTCCGIKVYSPIVHGHAIARAGNLDPLDWLLYVPLNMAMIPIFDALIVAHLDGWQESEGTADEINEFEKLRKPVFDLNPETLVMTRRRGPLVYEPEPSLAHNKTPKEQGGASA